MNNSILDIIYNEGERLIPFVTHHEDEVIRHFSSYNFFCQVIQKDLKEVGINEVNILDIGFGCGYGCFILSKIHGVKQVTGIDVSYACKSYAQENYGARNIEFVIADAGEYLQQNYSFNYITSRGVLEHIPNGLSLTNKSNYHQRLIIDVPYNEKPGNDHHVLLGIKEDAFEEYENYELFYEGIDGTIYDADNKPDDANMILCVASRQGLSPVSKMFNFPIKPVTIEYVKNEMLAHSEDSISQSQNRYFSYEKPSDLLLAAQKAIHEVDVVLDIGPGIAPMNYFRPKFHILLEPFPEYVQILTHRFANDGSVFIISDTAQDFMSSLAPNSVDSVFLLDVIEHLPKEDGINLLAHAERVARKQIIIFTPLGFMPQTVHEGEKDGWGLGGASVQEHLSGWIPEDFGCGWDFHICETFHKYDFRNQLLSKEYGAFFATKNFFSKPTPNPESIPNIRKLLPSEAELEKVSIELNQTKQYLVNNQHELISTQHELLKAQHKLQQLEKIAQHPIVRSLRKVRKLLTYVKKMLFK